ncbi:hypothetical protein U0070_011986 [Myodes glareolus]|uniref:Serine aminopeptidase S33 domain-containing protein n=1 Tax=Myodes glareolus TaxID=447135 RepID=A0AAW0HRA2_MYOGA
MRGAAERVSLQLRAGDRCPSLPEPLQGPGGEGADPAVLPCDRDEGTALFRLALILEAVAVVECKSQDGMETGPEDLSRMPEANSPRRTPQNVPYQDLPHLINADGQYLFCRYWKPSGTPNVRPPEGQTGQRCQAERQSRKAEQQPSLLAGCLCLQGSCPAMPPNAVVLLATWLCSHSTDACGCGDESSCLTVPIAVPSESHTSFSTFDLSLISPPEWLSAWFQELLVCEGSTWQVSVVAARVALIFVSHGAGEHCGRYDELAQMLKGLDMMVFAHDHGEYL